MPVTIEVQINPSHRQSVLASAVVTFQIESATIEIHDCRVMRNRQGVMWAALPSYSFTSGREYQYFQSVVLNPTLHREVSDAILAAFERPIAEGGVR